jgi:hypothetical protein
VSIAAHVRYILRRGEYVTKKDVIHWETCIPDWAAGPTAYWTAADKNERANARLGRSFDIALPTELNQTQQITLARKIAEEIATTPEGKLPYVWSLHQSEGNPHIHIIVSERLMDDSSPERDAKTWFSRSGRGDAGGAPKTRRLQTREWLFAIRAKWADLANAALAAAGIDQRIDSRSLAAQGIDRTPGRHIGPFAAAEARAASEVSALQGAEATAEAELAALDAAPPQVQDPIHNIMMDADREYDAGMAALIAASAQDDETEEAQDDEDDAPGIHLSL